MGMRKLAARLDRCVMTSAAVRRKRHSRQIALEALEDRTVLSTVSINYTSGTLLFSAAATDVASDISISYDAATRTYTLVDSANPLTLDGEYSYWVEVDEHTVRGPAADPYYFTPYFTSIEMTGLAEGGSRLAVDSVGDQIEATDFSQVSIGGGAEDSTGSLDKITSNVTVSPPTGSVQPAIILNDAGNTNDRTWTFEADSLSFGGSSTLSLPIGSIASLTVRGGAGANGYTINDLFAPTTIIPGTGVDAFDVLGASLPLTIDQQTSPTVPSIDTVNVQTGPALVGPLSVLGTGNQTRLSLDASSQSGGLSVSILGRLISGLTSAPIVVDPSGLAGLEVLGGAGADTLTIDFSQGNVVPTQFGLLFTGGGGANTLGLMGDAGFSTQRYEATNASDGSIEFDNSLIRFTDLSPIIDTVPVQDFTFVASGTTVNVNVVDGPISQGFQTTEIVSGDTPSSFERIAFANKQNVLIDLTRDGSTSAGGEVITFNTPTRATGLNALTLYASSSPDQINVLATAPGVVTSLQAGPLDDQFRVVPAGLGVGGSLSLDGGTGTDSLAIDAQGALVTFSQNSLTIGALPDINFVNLEQVTVTNAADAPLTPYPTTIRGLAGLAFLDVLVGEFTSDDPSDPISSFQAVIDWGDGTAPTVGRIAYGGGESASYAVHGDHTYAEPGQYNIRITVTNQPRTEVTTLGPTTFSVTDQGNATTVIESLADIPALDITGEAFPVTVREDTPFTAPLLSFRVNLPQEYFDTAHQQEDEQAYYAALFPITIDWGDGTLPSPGIVTLQDDNSLLVTGSHLYTRETLPGQPNIVTITVDSRWAGVHASFYTIATVLSNNVVTTEADSGEGSLRAVIEDLNQDGVPTTVRFAIPGNGPHRIVLNSPLPEIWHQVHIAGQSQPGYRGEPLIEISGTLAGAGANGLVLAGAGYSVIDSVVVNGFDAAGILLLGPGGNLVRGSRIGTDLSGTRAVPNGVGIRVQDSALNVIGGITGRERNLISGNLVAGIGVSGPGSRYNVVLGNLIGTDVSGLSALSNYQGVVIADASQNQIGVMWPGMGNVISGNQVAGVEVAGAGSQFNVIQGNRIGTDVSGLSALPNYQGIVILGSSRNLIGGTLPGMGNVISGNSSVGIQIFNAATIKATPPLGDQLDVASENVIQGNFIGTTPDGQGRLGNAQGIFVNDASNNLIGGSVPGSGNVIAGNRSIGMQILGDHATGNAVLGNHIGMILPSGQSLGNGTGIYLYAAPGNFIDLSTSAANSITANASGNVEVRELAQGPLVERVGLGLDASGRQILSIGVIFTTYVDETRVRNVSNYILTPLGQNLQAGPPLQIDHVEYDEANRFATIVLASPLPRNTHFRLRVMGTAPNGITDRVGNFLDGNPDVVRTPAGSDYETEFQQGIQVDVPQPVQTPQPEGRKPFARGPRGPRHVVSRPRPALEPSDMGA